VRGGGGCWKGSGLVFFLIIHSSLACLRKKGQIKLQRDIWENEGIMSEWEEGSFSEKENTEALGEMKPNIARETDGFTLRFYKTFWEEIKEVVVEMFNKFHRGKLNLRRLNFGLISLISKLKEADNIKQYRSMCLLGVDYKWFTKLLTKRLSRVAETVISKNQTAFIEGRNILDGVVILHETLHELKRKKKKGMILKLDIGKAYHKVQ
jgi:hypothetical protein